MVPDLDILNSGVSPIHYIKIEGVWEKNTNLAEANRVVELVQELSEKYPDKKMGIVTFKN